MSNKLPAHSNQSSPEGRPNRQKSVGSAFRIGNQELAEDVFEGGKRIFKWVPTEVDARLAVAAGWDNLPNGIDDEGFGFIEVPAGTRSATSVLSGLEAWDGEKTEILTYLAEYEKVVNQDFGGIDVSVGLDDVAVTKDRRLFITPPHNVTTNTQELSDWYLGLIHDLNEVMAIDPNRDEIMNNFFERLSHIRPEGA